MITGRGSGSGKYSFHQRTSGNKTVMVTKMPEDQYSIRIVFQHNGETSIPIVKISTSDAERLWAALNSMAADLEWKDME